MADVSRHCLSSSIWQSSGLLIRGFRVQISGEVRKNDMEGGDNHAPEQLDVGLMPRPRRHRHTHRGITHKAAIHEEAKFVRAAYPDWASQPGNKRVDRSKKGGLEMVKEDTG